MAAVATGGEAGGIGAVIEALPNQARYGYSRQNFSHYFKIEVCYTPLAIAVPILPNLMLKV